MNSIGFKINKISKEVVQKNETCFIETTISIDNKEKCTVKAEKVNINNSIRVIYVPLKNTKTVSELSRNTKKFIESILKAYILGTNNIIEFKYRTNCLENNCSLEE